MTFFRNMVISSDIFGPEMISIRLEIHWDHNILLPDPIAPNLIESMRITAGFCHALRIAEWES